MRRGRDALPAQKAEEEHRRTDYPDVQARGHKEQPRQTAFHADRHRVLTAAGRSQLLATTAADSAARCRLPLQPRRCRQASRQSTRRSRRLRRPKLVNRDRDGLSGRRRQVCIVSSGKGRKRLLPLLQVVIMGPPHFSLIQLEYADTQHFLQAPFKRGPPKSLKLRSSDKTFTDDTVLLEALSAFCTLRALPISATQRRASSKRLGSWHAVRGAQRRQF